MMKLTPRVEKKLDAAINTIFNQNCSNIQIDIMDIPKIFRVGRVAALPYLTNPNHRTVDGALAAAAFDMKTSVVNFVQQIRKN